MIFCQTAFATMQGARQTVPSTRLGSFLILTLEMILCGVNLAGPSDGPSISISQGSPRVTSGTHLVSG